MHICREPLVLAMLEIIEAILPSYSNKGQGKDVILEKKSNFKNLQLAYSGSQRKEGYIYG